MTWTHVSPDPYCYGLCCHQSHNDDAISALGSRCVDSTDNYFPWDVQWVLFYPKHTSNWIHLSPSRKAIPLLCAMAQRKAPPSRSDASILNTSFSPFLPHQSPKPHNQPLRHLSYLSIALYPFFHPLSVGHGHFLPRLMPQAWNCLSSPGPAPPDCIIHTVTNQLSEMQSPSSRCPHWKAQFLTWIIRHCVILSLPHSPGFPSHLSLLPPTLTFHTPHSRIPLIPSLCHVLSCLWVYAQAGPFAWNILLLPLTE